MLLRDPTGRVSLAKSTSCSCHRSTILGNQSDGCAAVERLRPGAWKSLPCLGSDASLLLEIAHAVYRLPHWEGGTKKGPLPLAREAAHKICGARIKGSRNVCVWLDNGVT
ncbi:hypothetical protein XAC2852_370026 [Xanthomonas citri pv. citri]|uniref:Uncharacterized protein n=1 Tax=Xanthomonas citri pv. citri TaxID=611301 RepID=A0A0U5FH18_XANCI|nr:hypothetical protein XAC3824_360095 [Xanthomonas citri pv. citri]CEE36982.1 hypothetical protein XAC902_430092 [Xanthomonas citri pv. citri]CEE58006.1 hypothetical protein XACS584_1800003 [Xanthomonas citri pv. citri]CEE58363.1 hypothetical protein XAC71A_390093 [Xanthomonas citri pv. citri]CEE67565.1 hypothetical protein XAC2852_370026 [Xanthomonas citri pv. citri]